VKGEVAGRRYKAVSPFKEFSFTSDRSRELFEGFE
jgi:hypothetical protein